MNVIKYEGVLCVQANKDPVLDIFHKKRQLLILVIIDRLLI